MSDDLHMALEWVGMWIGPLVFSYLAGWRPDVLDG